MKSLEELWELVTEVLKESLSEVIYNVWLKDLVPVSFEDGAVTLAICEFKRKIVEQKFNDVLSDAFEKVLGFPAEIILIEPDGSDKEQRDPSSPERPQNEENTFETFVVGSSNKFAHAAALAVAANPGGAYNPLFIYGRSGLGKTHLLGAIASEIQSVNPDLKVVLTHGEQFTNELVYYIAQRNMSDFHNKYRSADVLLMDDVQFIAGRERTQEEVFHTFNTLTQAGNQVVLTSDKPPKDIMPLEERLRARFEWGLIADIQPPDVETRMAIIKRKAQVLDLELSDDVIQYIADKLKNNIRQLEGAVKKIKAIVAIHGSLPNMVTVQNAIKDIQSEERPDSVIIEKVVGEVARTYGADPADIRSKKRDAQTSRMRQMSMYIISEMTNLSTKAIGNEFSGRDHSTVVYALQEMRRLLEKDSSLRSAIDDITKNVSESD